MAVANSVLIKDEAVLVPLIVFESLRMLVKMSPTTSYNSYSLVSQGFMLSTARVAYLTNFSFIFS
jgi:hypothetical protein